MRLSSQTAHIDKRVGMKTFLHMHFLLPLNDFAQMLEIRGETFRDPTERLPNALWEFLIQNSTLAKLFIDHFGNAAHVWLFLSHVITSSKEQFMFPQFRHTIRNFGTMLSPVESSAPNLLTSELLRTL